MYPVEISETAASGGWTENTARIANANCLQIIIKADSSDTTFDFKITDPYSNVVYDTLLEEMTATGTLNVRDSIPMRGVYTLEVYNSSADEAFTGRVMIGD